MLIPQLSTGGSRLAGVVDLSGAGVKLVAPAEVGAGEQINKACFYYNMIIFIDSVNIGHQLRLLQFAMRYPISVNSN